MNGLSSFNSPSLNGLRRNDGSSKVESVQQLTGSINHTTSDSSFFYETQGDDTIVLQVPFTTLGDTLTTERVFKARKIVSEEPIDVCFNLIAGSNITINHDEATNEYTISANIPNQGGGTSTFGSWRFEAHPDGYLNLVKDNRILFRFLSDPINIMTRVSEFKMLQNSSWAISK